MEEVSPLALLLIFGTNAVVTLSLWNQERLAKISHSVEYELVPTSNGKIPSAHKGKQLSGPLSMNIKSIHAFSSELFRLGLILLTIYICERHPIFPHESKVHDMDTFWCMVALLAIACALNVRKGKCSDVLNREQTEEWKGWMQFIFLLYHYFSAHEVYNSVRVMITSYVWMTGFGNLSFFYLKADYGLVRLLQMLWRLNFLVTLLCLTLGNTYILYYICPLHTFYFLMVYVIMRIASKTNYTKAIRVKLLIAAGFIYLVWDANLGIFEKIFFFLGQSPKIGAGSGTMWEWYFRSSLDHWSTFLGMIFALNFPVTALWVKKVEALPFKQQWLIKGSVSVCMLSAFIWWVVKILPQPKLQYNDNNAYYGVIIPLLTYIFIRNLNPTLRIHYVEPLHSIGKITLETYLMQHHIWLTSNAKTVLTLVPSYPRLNMVVTTVLYVMLSKELYRLTMSLRGMLLPDDRNSCIRNISGIISIFVLAFGVSFLLVEVNAGPFLVIGAIFMIGIGALLCLHVALSRRSKAASSPQSTVGGDYSGGLVRAGNIWVLVLGTIALSGGILFFEGIMDGGVTGKDGSFGGIIGPHDHCLANINHGLWESDVGTCAETHALYCDSHSWRWVDIPDDCHFRYIQPDEMKSKIYGKTITFLGDSTQRMTYYAYIRSLGYPTPEAHDATVEKHTDLSWKSTEISAEISFQWAPFAENVTEKITDMVTASKVNDMIVIGIGLWDALHIRDVNAYNNQLTYINHALENPIFSSALKIWVTTNAVVEERLTPEKREWLTDNTVSQYRNSAGYSPLMNQMSAVIDGYEITNKREIDSYDGVHYADFVYDAMAQLLANVAYHYGWSHTTKAPSAKHIGSMSHPLLGLLVIFCAIIMLFTMDAYHGLSKLALKIVVGDVVTWEDAYGPILAKLNKRVGQSPGGNSPDNPRAPISGPETELRELGADLSDTKADEKL